MGSWLDNHPLRASNDFEAFERQFHEVPERVTKGEAAKPTHPLRTSAEYDDYVTMARLELAARDHNDLAVMASRDGKQLQELALEDFYIWETELVEGDYALRATVSNNSFDPTILQCIQIRNELRSLERSLAKLSPDIRTFPSHLRPVLECIGAQLEALDLVAMQNMQLGQRFKLPTHDGSGVTGQFDPRKLLPYPKCVNDYESFDTRHLDPILLSYYDLLTSRSEDRDLIARIVQQMALAISGFIKSQLFRTRNEISLLRRACMDTFTHTRLHRIGLISSEEYLGWAIYCRRPVEDILTISPNVDGIYTHNLHKLTLWTLTPALQNGAASWLYPTISCCLNGSISQRMERLDEPFQELGRPELTAISLVLSALETNVKAHDSIAQELILEHFGVPNCPYYFIYSRIAVQTKFAWRIGKAPPQITKISFFVESKVDYDVEIREHVCRETAAWLNTEIQNGLLVRLEAERAAI